MARADITVRPERLPQSTIVNGLRVREDLLYTNARGEPNAGIRKRADKALARLQEPLARVLQADEAILYIARCQAPLSAFEQFTIGAWGYRSLITDLVITNRRLLHFSVRPNGNWKHSLRVVNWGDPASVKVKAGLFSGMLILKSAEGRTAKYWRLRRIDAKAIQAILEVVVPASSGDLSPAHQMVSLCPDCLAVLTPRVYECGQCGLKFKSEKALRRLAILPGGAYFYAGMTVVGIFTALADLYLLILFLTMVVFGATGAGFAHEQRAGTIIAAVFLGVLIFFEKWLTVYHAQRLIREFMPLPRPAGSATGAVVGR